MNDGTVWQGALIMTSASAANDRLSALAQLARAGAFSIAAVVLPFSAVAEPPAIPNLSSADFGWQSNVGDWQAPPPGYGRGPIQPHPDHPFTSNADGFRTGTQPTKRIGNHKDPVLKPWAAAQ